jgi:hypothetical protein
MRTRFASVWVIALVSAWGCEEGGKMPSSQVNKLYGGPSAINTVQNSTSVQAYRLPSPSEHVQSLADYTMSAGPIAVPEATVAKLREMLMDEDVYLWDVAKACGEPDYAVRFQFQRGGDNVDVLICFHCDILGVYHNGQAVDFEDCDPIRPQLIAIVKDLFPGDPAIQSLKMTF